MKNILALILLLLFVSCSKEKPDTSGFEKAVVIGGEVQPDNLMIWVEQLAIVRANDSVVDNTDFPPEDMFPSDHLTRNAAAGLVASEFEAMGYRADTAVLGEGTYITYNVYAELPGTVHPEEVILVACHLDGFYSAADDNGSAVAAMLETARIARNHSFARTIRFISFDLEEFGAIGSTRYVEAGYANDVKAAIVMDAIGYASDEPGSQKEIPGLKLPDKGNFLLAIGNKDSREITQQFVAMGNSYGLSKLLGVLAPGDATYFLPATLFMRSDQGLLWYNGIPAIFLSDGANYRNSNYHKETDLPETLNLEFLAGNTKVLVSSVALFAEVQP